MKTPDADIIGMALELSRMLSREYRKTPDVNLLRLSALLTIQERKDLTLTEFAEGMNISASTASICIRRLRRSGLVTQHRDAGNKRKIRIRLSGAGLGSIRRADATKLKVIGRVFSVLTKEDRAHFGRILEKLLAPRPR